MLMVDYRDRNPSGNAIGSNNPKTLGASSGGRRSRARIALTRRPDNEPGTAPGDRAFRPDIEGLRGIAVLMVVLFHATLLHVVGGYVGVDVFFVISGYVITGLILREQGSTGGLSLVKFYGRRAARIVPMALLVLVAAMLAERVVEGATFTHQYADSARWTAIFLANFHSNFLLGTYWSLAVEEQFYLVYPVIVLMTLFVLRRWQLRNKLCVVLSVTALLSYGWAGFHPALAYASPWGRAWELAVGGLLSVATGYLKGLPPLVAAAMTWCGFIGLVIIALGLQFTNSYAGTVAVLPVITTALIIGGGTAHSRIGAESLLRLAPFKYLGRWSYSIYILHWPILLLTIQHWGRVNAFWRLVVVVFVVVLSAITYSVIEDPIRRSSFLKRRPWVSIFSAIFLIVVSVAIMFGF
jgi:peptidoglycan/LPS O-acetylase OafA/YrhL